MSEEGKGLDGHRWARLSSWFVPGSVLVKFSV
jgi:hypothetical protein